MEVKTNRTSFISGNRRGLLHTLTYNSNLTARDGYERTFNDKRDYFNFPIVNFPFICSNISAAPAYRVYITKLIRYSRACGSYKDSLDRGLLLTWKLLNQGLLLVKMKSSLRKFYGRHHPLVDRFWNICPTNDYGYVPFVVNDPFLIHD